MRLAEGTWSRLWRVDANGFGFRESLWSALRMASGRRSGFKANRHSTYTLKMIVWIRRSGIWRPRSRVSDASRHLAATLTPRDLFLFLDDDLHSDDKARFVRNIPWTSVLEASLRRTSHPNGDGPCQPGRQQAPWSPLTAAQTAVFHVWTSRRCSGYFLW